jgi:tetratricopeptide (TPR) repeat protein
MKQRLTLILSLLMAFALQAQEEEPAKKKRKIKDFFFADSSQVVKNLLVNPELLEGDAPLWNAQVMILDDGNPVDSAYTDSAGKASFELPFGGNYTMLFMKPDYVTKKLIIDTRDMPEEDKQYGYDLGRFQMRLFRKAEGMDLEAYEKPVAKYVYSPTERLFIVERKYTKKRAKELEPVKAQNEALLEELLAEEAAVQTEYEAFVRDGDIEMQNRDYDAAIENYREALKIKPNAEYPKAQIAKANRDRKEYAEKKKRYDLLILQGDNAFGLDNLDRARESYENALSIFPEELYPKLQLQKVANRKVELGSAPTGPAKKKRRDPKDYTLDNIQVTGNSDLINNLAQKYPQGLTEEVSTEGGKTITRRIIVQGNIGVEYKRIRHSWGGEFFLKNGEQTTEFIWQKETEQY